MRRMLTGRRPVLPVSRVAACRSPARRQRLKHTQLCISGLHEEMSVTCNIPRGPSAQSCRYMLLTATKRHCSLQHAPITGIRARAGCPPHLQACLSAGAGPGPHQASPPRPEQYRYPALCIGTYTDVLEDLSCREASHAHLMPVGRHDPPRASYQGPKNTPVDDAAGDGRLGGTPLGGAQLHNVVRRHLVRGQRDCCQRSSTLHMHAPSASICRVGA